MIVVAALISAAFAAGQASAKGGCLQARAPLAADAIPDSKNFARADCPANGASPAFRYDRTLNCTRLSRAVAASEIVPLYPEFGRDMIHPGETLHLVAVSGTARIERDVEAMQPAEPGQRLFVKTHDGQILSVRYESGGP